MLLDGNLLRQERNGRPENLPKSDLYPFLGHDLQLPVDRLGQRKRCKRLDLCGKVALLQKPKPEPKHPSLK